MILSPKTLSCLWELELAVVGWLQSCLVCLHIAPQEVLPCREAAGTAKGLGKFYRLSRAAAKLCVIHSASLLPSLSLNSQRKKAGDSARGDTAPNRHKVEQRHIRHRAQPSTSLQAPVTHPPSTAQIHFSVSQASWITLSPWHGSLHQATSNVYFMWWKGMWQLLSDHFPGRCRAVSSLLHSQPCPAHRDHPRAPCI